MSPKARDRARAKRRYVKRQAKLAQRAQSRRTRQQVFAAVIAVIVVIGGIFAVSHFAGSSPSSKKQPSAAARTGASAECPVVAKKTVAKPAQFKTAPPKSLAAGRTWTASIATSCGAVTVSLDGAKAPQTVASFIYLARKGFFDNTTCHRLTTSGIYVLQCGDPTGTGGGGPGYGFGIENAPASGAYPAGTVAMARTDDPKSNGSQFFLVYKDSTLPTTGGGYSIFGTVTGGLDVLQKAAAGGVAAGGTSASDGAPQTPVNITSVSVK